MPRQRLPGQHRDGGWVLGPGAISDQPSLAAIIGRCLGLWTDVELQMAILLSILLKTDTAAATDAAIAVYLVLRRSTPRYDALKAAGDATLAPKDRELLGAVLRVHQAAEAERNALAHGSYGSHPNMPESILWIDTSDIAHFITSMLRRESKTGTRHTANDEKLLGRKLSHYTAKDLEAIYAQILQAHQTVFNFSAYLRTSKPEIRDEQYGQLCSSPPIREALRALRDGAHRSKRSALLRLRIKALREELRYLGRP
jgi:hypothetical protein